MMLTSGRAIDGVSVLSQIKIGNWINLDGLVQVVSPQILKQALKVSTNKEKLISPYKTILSSE